MSHDWLQVAAVLKKEKKNIEHVVLTLSRKNMLHVNLELGGFLSGNLARFATPQPM